MYFILESPRRDGPGIMPRRWYDVRAGRNSTRRKKFSSSPSRRRRVADRHHERELVVGNIGGRGRGRLGASGQRHTLSPSRAAARPPQPPAPSPTHPTPPPPAPPPP